MYAHYIGLEWANTNMVIARMTEKSKSVKTIDGKSNIKELQIYLDSLKGKKIITFEETTPSHWLYTELKDHVDEIIVCDAYRNKLLLEGAKNDRADAEKLVQLLKSGLLKPVYHCNDQFYYIRKLVSGYIDVVKSSVRLQNQRSALLRSVGKGKKENVKGYGPFKIVLDGIDRNIKNHEYEISVYQDEFERLKKKHKVIRDLESIPGIGVIGAVKIAAYVIDARRFVTRNKFYSYCGLVKHEKISGGKSYGSKKPRCNRILKNVFDTAALSCLGQDDSHILKSYYNYLIYEKRYPNNNARRALSRRIASIALGIMKTGKRFNKRKVKKCKSESH